MVGNVANPKPMKNVGEQGLIMSDFQSVADSDVSVVHN